MKPSAGAVEATRRIMQRYGDAAMGKSYAPDFATVAQIIEEATQVSELRAALEKIANPIAALQKEAEESDMKINGHMAVLMSEDASYLKGIARAVLSKGKE